MKFLYTLVAIMVSIIINAAGMNTDSLPLKVMPAVSLSFPNPGNVANAKIGFICRAGKSSVCEEPLLVIDGVLYEFNEIKTLNPDNIASINILKDVSTIGCRPARGVIIVTTKTAQAKKFIIKDFLNGDKVPLSTVYFTSKYDTIKAAANDSGILVIDKLKPGVHYEIIVSCTGYKSFTTIVKGVDQEILLERDVKTCDEVVVKGFAHHCHRYLKLTCVTDCRLIHSKTKAEDSPALTNGLLSKQSIYPNPVQRNNVFNIEFASKQDDALQLTILSLNGKRVMLQGQKAVQGLNHLSITADARWSAGIYIVQLRNQKGTIIKQEKLIVK